MKRSFARIIERLKSNRFGNTILKLWQKANSSNSKRRRAIAGFGLSFAVILLAVIGAKLLLGGPTYELGAASKLLPATSPTISQLVAYDSKQDAFTYNSGYVPTSTGVRQTPGPKITATAHKVAANGVTVSDPTHRTNFTLKPQFDLLPGKQDRSRIIYPLEDNEGWLVYGMHSTSVKEDVILTESPGDEFTLEYTLGLEDGMEARLESNGSIGVYGNLALLGDVGTGSDEDSQLLKKARENAQKDTLLFSLPAPVVIEQNQRQSSARSVFELEDNSLRVVTRGLDDATYPLSIDPSIYVETAEKFMRGNNETNIDFDTANTLIQKGETTGARFDDLLSTTDLPSNRWGHDTAVAGGYIYSIGGNDGTSNQSTVQWAKFSTVDNTITSPNPGDGACTDWCNETDYNLPSARAGHTLTTYNGYLYVLGGEDASCTTGNGTGNNGICDTVYIAKLGANGEPQLWHPTDSDKANWVYWYRDTDLSSPRSYAAAAPYDNRLYLLGGKTDSASGGVTTVEYVDLRPFGTLSSWTTTGMTVLPSARFDHDVHAYNDYIYLVGGNSSGTLQNSVEYIKLNADGTMVSSWSNANNFSIARSGWGGQFSTITGGYLYISGGCSAVDAEGECTTSGITNGGTYQTDGSGTSVELASINADGSLGFWGNITNITNTRIGYTLTSWRNTIYSIGGCTAQNTTTGACSTTTNDSLYGVVNEDGDGSTVSTSEPSGTAPCSGADPFNCDLPGTSTIGNMLSGTAIMNGYLYIIGGCTNDACTSVSGNTIFSAIDSDGQLRRPASCAGGTITDSFCVDSTDPISGGVAAAGTAVFGGRIYVIGGQDGSGLKGNIYHVEVNNDGSLSGAWNSQTFAAVDATSVSYTFGYARANPSQASTYPGNLYIFGGCSASTGGVDCTSGSNTDAVYKCSIQADGSLEESDANDCTTTGQLQIGTVAGASGAGLALHSGAVYANYIYLVGGSAPGIDGLDTLRYAKFDNSNNVVAATGSAWAEPTDAFGDPVEMSTGRQRSASFGYNGYLYALGGYDSSGTGTLSDIQFAKINTSNGSLEQFNTSSITIDQRWGLNVPVSNSYAYIIGGCDAGSSPTCTSRTDTVQTFQIYNNASGAPADYNSAANLFATDRFGNSATILNGYAYVAGGCIGTINCDNATNVVEYAPLNDDGSLGSWSSTAALPVDLVNGQMEAVGGSLYFMGGENDSGTTQSTIYYATPASNGTISSWSTASGGLGDTSGAAATPRSQFGATVWNDRIYVVGGFDAGDITTNTVFVSPQLSSGGDIAADSWTADTSFSTARDGATAIAYANNLYVLGGHDGINYLSDVQYTQINADGTLDSWNYTTSLPRNVSNADGFAANGYMYIYGGKQSDINCTSNTYVAPISANTSIASGNNPTGLGSWFLTNERFSAERAYTTAVYNEGKAYLFGGSCGDLEAVPGTDVIDDDFDAALDGTMWSSTTDMAVGTTCGTLDSGNALYSTGDDTAQAITKDVDVSYGGTLSFYLRIPAATGGSCRGPGPGEDLVLQYSSNGGSGWTTFATYDEANFDTATLIEETIPSVAQTPTTRFRWYIPEADNNRDQWAIDTLVVNAFVTPPLLEVLEDDFDPSIDGADWASTTDMATGIICGTLSSGNALYSTGGNTAQAITTDVNLQYGGLVSFVLRIPANSGGGCDQPQNDEDVELQYSTNAGSTWTTFATYDEGNYDTPTTITTGIPQGARSSAVRFRWYNPNADSGSDQWAIDDVTIDSLQPILTYTGIHRAVYTSLLAQPQVAKYSIMFDTDSDVFPNYWLLNGVDNSIGAEWQLDYRSMTDTTTSCTSPAMTTWGQTVNFGNVTLGQPGVYNPLDGSGTDTDCARFYYFSVSVDSSKAYGYPEDVERGPTINDLTLQFTADPNKRLMHGRTFTGGLQQPLDTPVDGF